MTTYKIISKEIFTDCAVIVEKYGQGCNYSTGNAVDGYQVDFDIEVTNNKSEIKNFNISFQTCGRTDNLRGYNGYEMCTSASFGNDGDESPELAEFTNDDDEEIIDELCSIAESDCKDFLESYCKYFLESYEEE